MYSVETIHTEMASLEKNETGAVGFEENTDLTC